MERRLREKLPHGDFIDVTPVDSGRQRAVRGKGNRTTELRLRAAMVQAGIAGWKLRLNTMRGKPDFVFLEHRIVIFVDGCFWHGCPMCGHIPTKNKPFWEAKILRNRQRDRTITGELKNQGFTVLRFWEHELKTDLRGCLKRVRSAVTRRKNQSSRMQGRQAPLAGQ